MNDATQTAVLALTVYQTALAALGHKFSLGVDGSVELEANPERAGRWGEVTEEDHRIAEDAVRAAWDAGERSGRVLGVVLHPDTDEIVPRNDEVPPPIGQWSTYQEV